MEGGRGWIQLFGYRNFSKRDMFYHALKSLDSKVSMTSQSLQIQVVHTVTGFEIMCQIANVDFDGASDICIQCKFATFLGDCVTLNQKPQTQLGNL